MTDHLRLAYESLKERTPITWESFLTYVKDWEVFPAKDGAVLRKGPELHACIKPSGFCKWFNKSMFVLLNDTIQKHGYALTRVTEGNISGDQFVRRLGFHLTHSDSGNWVYRKD